MSGADSILVDETPVNGQDLFGFTSIRGRQAVQGQKPDADGQRQRYHQFDGLNLILVQDPMQLPPVGAAPMWSDIFGTVWVTVEGLVSWLGIHARVEVTDVTRQLGEVVRVL